MRTTPSKPLPIFSLDIKECDLGTDGCHDNATCTDGNGSYTCECNIGYTGDGFSCNGTFLLISIYLIGALNVSQASRAILLPDTIS